MKKQNTKVNVSDLLKENMTITVTIDKWCWYEIKLILAMLLIKWACKLTKSELVVQDNIKEGKL